MNRGFSTIKIYSLFVIILLLTNIQSFSQNSKPFSINESPLPAPTSPVMDYSGVLDASTKQSIEKKIIDFRNQIKPPVELAVAIVDTTGDRDIFDYSLAVARGWGIGSKEDDNPGALLFIAIKDRKYFTQISKDLEDELPDGLAGQLQRQYLVPAFKQGDYGKGVSDTIDAYIRTIKARSSGEQQPVGGITPDDNARRGGSRSGGGISNVGCCLIILFILLIIIFSRFGSGGGRGGRGGGSGWSGGGFGGALPWIIGSILANSGGRSSGGSSSGWGGGFSGGGSGGWGGFGGGGDFGGGGAGGSW